MGGGVGRGEGVRETLRRDVPWTPSPILRTDSNSESHSGSLPPPRTHSFSENRTANLEPGVSHSGGGWGGARRAALIIETLFPQMWIKSIDSLSPLVFFVRYLCYNSRSRVLHCLSRQYSLFFLVPHTHTHTQPVFSPLACLHCTPRYHDTASPGFI